MKYAIGLIALLITLITWSCEDEFDFITDGNFQLTFSVDTLRFDTVFTELGSATRSIKVYNPNDRPVRIGRVFPKGGQDSPFRFNVDGIPGRDFSDVEILAEDSIYVFVEVTVDPNQPLSVSPFVIEESLVFQTDETAQEVHLEAWGQNANYFPSRFNQGVPVVLSCNNGDITWDDPKPYVIYGEVFIDSCTLNIPAGTRVYVHGGIVENDLFGVFNDGILFVLENGRLRIQGTAEEPVVIQGDRLEEPFQEVDGQWNGIIIGQNSKGNRFEHAIIKNAINNVIVDSAATLVARNCQIFNSSGSALVGIHSTINAQNTILYNAGNNAVQLLHGGDYRFTYCTVASYGVTASALAMSNFQCYDDPCEVRSDYRLNAIFTNSILFGSQRDELIFSDISGGEQPDLFNIRFDHCIVRAEDLLTEQNGLYSDFFQNQCMPCINGERTDPLFLDPNEDLYTLDSMSIAIEQGKPLTAPTGVMTDLLGNPRDPQAPDLGAYEFVEE